MKKGGGNQIPRVIRPTLHLWLAWARQSFRSPMRSAAVAAMGFDATGDKKNVFRDQGRTTKLSYSHNNYNMG